GPGLVNPRAAVAIQIHDAVLAPHIEVRGPAHDFGDFVLEHANEIVLITSWRCRRAVAPGPADLSRERGVGRDADPTIQAAACADQPQRLLLRGIDRQVTG